jgi:hypothetical protein
MRERRGSRRIEYERKKRRAGDRNMRKKGGSRISECERKKGGAGQEFKQGIGGGRQTSVFPARIFQFSPSSDLGTYLKVLSSEMDPAEIRLIR